MYEQHFGLNKRPFRASAVGADVFVGPQTAKTMSALKKVADTPDAVVTVTGPVGVGKTTIVHRALKAIGDNSVIVSVGRIQLSHDEVLELLLDELGTRQMPAGTVQRFGLFRRLLKGFADSGRHVFFVVEDAARIGLGALSEIEALTASDAGVSDGANIILMGEPGINELMKSPELARLKQRIRVRESIAELGTNELRAYLMHSFRNAGREFDSIFEKGTVELMHRHSSGIPRVVNNTVETILASAAENKLNKITTAFISSVVGDECGITLQTQPQGTAGKTASAPVATPESAPEPAAESKPVNPRPTMPVTENKPAQSTVVDSALEKKSVSPTIPVVSKPFATAVEKPIEKQVIVEQLLPKAPPAEAAVPSTASDDDDIPELIQDTLPNLQILAPGLLAQPTLSEIKKNLDADYASKPLPEVTPVTVTANGGADDIPDDDVPQLIFEGDDGPDSGSDQDDDGIPTLPSSMRLELPVADAKPTQDEFQDEKPEASGSDEIPAWDRDPTLAELRPDLEALERAMTYTLDEDQDLDPDQPTDNSKAAKNSGKSKTIVPEITLDRAIQQKIDEATELLKKTTIDLEEVAAEEAAATKSGETSNAPKPTVSIPPVVSKPPTERKPVVAPPPSTPAPPAPPVVKKPEIEKASMADTEMQKISSELSKAKTIDDIDDRMAETLFGDEFSQIAAQVVAAHAASRPMPDESANDDLQLVDEQPEVAEVAAPPVTAQSKPTKKPVVLPAESDEYSGMSATQRLRTVRALNGNFDPVPEPTETVVLAEETPDHASGGSVGQPESIEDQINTSMTQTLKALNVRPPRTIDIDDDDDDDGKGGFFSRFRRS